MKKMSIMMALAMASLSVAAQQTKTTDTLRVSTTPQMHCANCEKKIETSVPKQTVTIVYDPRKSSMQDFVAAFQKIGFTINQVDNKK